MPPGSSVYRSFVTCSDPEGVVDCKTVRKSRLEENSIERQKMAKSVNMLKDGDGNSRSSASQLEEIEKGAQKLNQMIESWASGMSIDGQSKDIAWDLLRGALDLQESLNMLSKLQEASLYMAKLKRLEKHKCESVLKGRVSVDRSSTRSSSGEELLKKVIQDSLVRQNLLPESHWDKRAISRASEVQSTSSSQSSVYFSKKALSTDNSSVSSDTSDKNLKRPNLIAKLMGLEDRKLVRAMACTSKELQNEKKVPAFDIDARRPQLATQKRCQEKRTLRELLEATQTKAHLESKFVERRIPVVDLLPRTHRANQTRVDADTFPPIVIMKPMHTCYTELQKSHTLPGKRRERGLNASEIVNEVQGKHWFSHVQDQVSERSSLIQNERNSTAQRLTQEKRVPITKTKIKEKAVVSMARTSSAEKISKIVKSSDGSNSTKKSAKEKNVNGTKLLVSKDALVVISPLKASKNPCTMTTQTSSLQKVSQPTISKFTKEAARCYSTGVKKARKRKENQSDTLQHEDDASADDLSCQVYADTHAVSLPVKTKIITEAEIEDNYRDVEVLHHISGQERSCKYYDDVNCETIPSNTSCLKSRSFRENLLLSSPSFAALVEVLFNLDLSAGKVVRPSINTEADTALFISYAKEVTERRSQQLPYRSTSMSIPISVHQLLEEVCNAYEAIDNYNDGTATVDILEMLDRDLKCKEVVSSVWDLGWKNGYSAGETEEIVAILEKLILGDFIDEIFVQ